MNNDADTMDDSVRPPSPKRIKLEEDPSEEERLLSQRRHSRGGRKPKFTAEERALILLNDDRISAVEPQQVLCRMCGHWVKLFKHTPFSPANWRTHAEKCEPRSGWRERIQADPGAAFALTIASLSPDHTNPAAEQVSTPSEHVASPLTVSAPQVESSFLGDAMSDEDSNEPLEVDNMLVPPRRITKTTADRRREVENDTRCEKSGAHQVLCKMCGQWVRLHNTREYDLWNWLRHAEKCEIRNGWVIPDLGDQASKDVSTAPGEDTASTNVLANGGCAYAKNAKNAPRTQNAADSAGTVTRALRGHVSVSRLSRSGIRRRLRQATSFSIEGDPPSKARTRSLRGGRTADTQCEQRDVFIHESGVSPNVDGEAVSGSNIQKSTNGPTISAVKAEPNAEDWLQHAQGPKVEDGSISTAVLVGMKRRKGRTVEERKQALLSDTRIGQVLPNEVFCNMCKKWIKLYKEVDYVESNWTRHAERCSLRVAAKQQPVGVRAFISAPVPSTSSSPPTDLMRPPVFRTNEDRRRFVLESDARIGAVEPHQVLCLICKQWIKLQSYREHDLWNWRKHISLCEQRHSDVIVGSSQTLPTHRRQTPLPSESKRPLRLVKAEEVDDEPSTTPKVTSQLTAPPKLSTLKTKDETSAEDRRTILMRDGRCENIEPQRVTCKLCQRVVGLHVKKDYSLSNWYKHIASCDKTPEKVVKSAIRTPLTAIGPSRPNIAAGPSTSKRVDADLDKGAKAPANDTPLEQDAEVQVVASALPQSSKSSKSTPAQRRERLLADFRVQAVEPNRIKCRLCQHWLKLNEFMDYAPYNWYKHIERCEARTGTQDQGMSVEQTVVKGENAEITEVAPHTNNLEPSISSDGGPRKRTTPAERLARMQTDPRIKTIEKHRARCGLCDKWVKLQNKTEYDPHNWFSHIKKCAEKSSVPTTEMAPVPFPVEKQAAKEPSPTIIADSDSEKVSNPTVLGRRTLLLNDIRAASVEPHRVLCSICNQWIKLRDGKEYVPYNWLKHKRKCERRNGLPQTSVSVNEDVVSAPRVVKKESVSADLGLHHNESRKITDEEREARLRADPRLGGVEPGRVFCKMCDNWIRLNMSSGFLPGNWLRHAQRCKGRASWQGATPEYVQEAPELSAVEVIDVETDNTWGHFGFIELARLIGKFEPTVSSTDYGNLTDGKPSTQAPTKQPSSTWSIPTLRARPSASRLNSPAPLSRTNSESKAQDPGKRMHRSEEARKHELESDPRTKIVHPEKILCGMCDRWIQMRRDVSYSPQNWLKHAGICEQRSGWLKKHKPESESDTKPVDEPVPQGTSEDFVPYNARKLMEENIDDFDAPPLKPVDWGQVISSDGEDDDEATVINDSSVPLSNVTGSLEPNQAPSVPVHHQDAMGTNSISNAHSGPKMSVSTPLASMRANNADLKAHPTPLPSSLEMKKPVSASPPIVAAPFTTVPLPFYRTPYPPHLIRPGYHTINKDGIPPKSASPQSQNNNAHQRTVPFVVPAPSMLPHLLPRPVLVPISHTSRRASRTVSPFPMSPVPSLRAINANTMPLPHRVATPQVSGATDICESTHGDNPTNSVPSSTASPSEVAKANGVASPIPVKSIHRHNTLMAEPSADKATLPPLSSEDNVRKSSITPAGQAVLSVARDAGASVELAQQEGGVTANVAMLQLGLREELAQEMRRANPTESFLHDNKRGSELKDAVPTKVLPDVLQLGPRPDMPLEKLRPERSMSISTATETESGPERTLSPRKSGPGVLRLAPGAEVLREKEREKREKDKGKEVLQLAPSVSNRRGESPERPDVPCEDIRMAAEPAQDAMLVEAL